MIKALGISNGKPLLIFGLSRKNCELLLEGKPIAIDLGLMRLESAEPQQYDFNHAKVMLCAGETEATLIKTLSKFTDLPPIGKALSHDEEKV